MGAGETGGHSRRLYRQLLAAGPATGLVAGSIVGVRSLIGPQRLGGRRPCDLLLVQRSLELPRLTNATVVTAVDRRRSGQIGLAGATIKRSRSSQAFSMAAPLAVLSKTHHTCSASEILAMVSASVAIARSS